MTKYLSQLVLFVLLIIGSCTSNSEKDSAENTEDAKDAVQEDPISRDAYVYTTRSGKDFIVSIDTLPDFGLQKVKIETRGFEEDNRPFELTELDPVEDIFLSDLNQDGYEEIYITTRSVGSGGYSSLYGYSSNRDKSISQIFVPDLIEMGPGTEGLYEGFAGHNTYSLENGSLVNTFPVYLPGDSNAQPTGGEQKVYYRLEAGESSWILNPEKQEKII